MRHIRANRHGELERITQIKITSSGQIVARSSTSGVLNAASQIFLGCSLLRKTTTRHTSRGTDPLVSPWETPNRQRLSSPTTPTMPAPPPRPPAAGSSPARHPTEASCSSTTSHRKSTKSPRRTSRPNSRTRATTNIRVGSSRCANASRHAHPPPDGPEPRARTRPICTGARRPRSAVPLKHGTPRQKLPNLRRSATPPSPYRTSAASSPTTRRAGSTSSRRVPASTPFASTRRRDSRRSWLNTATLCSKTRI